MTRKASCKTLQAEVLACIAHLRAYAQVLVNDPQRCDDLVCETIAQAFTGANKPPTGINLKILMFTALRRLHYGSTRRSIEGAATQPVRLSDNSDGVESDELLVVFYRLRDDQREVLILAVASGLSDEEAAEVCDCPIDTFRSRLLDARRAISRMLREASREQKMSFGMPAKKRIFMLSADAISAE
jgi:RNA polymerase sigma-70 factor (ECF subfamily)